MSWSDMVGRFLARVGPRWEIQGTNKGEFYATRISVNGTDRVDTRVTDVPSVTVSPGQYGTRFVSPVCDVRDVRAGLIVRCPDMLRTLALVADGINEMVMTGQVPGLQLVTMRRAAVVTLIDIMGMRWEEVVFKAMGQSVLLPKGCDNAEKAEAEGRVKGTNQGQS